MRSKAQLADILFSELKMEDYIRACLGQAGLDFTKSDPTQVQKIVDDVASGNVPGDPDAMLNAGMTTTITTGDLDNLKRKHGITTDELEKAGFIQKEDRNYSIGYETVIIARRDLVKGGMAIAKSETP